MFLKSYNSINETILKELSLQKQFDSSKKKWHLKVEIDEIHNTILNTTICISKNGNQNTSYGNINYSSFTNNYKK